MDPTDQTRRDRSSRFVPRARLNRARNRMARVFDLELYITLDAIPASLRNIDDSLEAHSDTRSEDDLDASYVGEPDVISNNSDSEHDPSDFPNTIIDNDDDDDDDDNDDVNGQVPQNEDPNRSYYSAPDERHQRPRPEEETSTLDIDELSELLDQDFLQLEIQLSEHLLLLLARQNFTNHNTLVEPPLPLRRSNAIRRRILPIPKRAIGAGDVKKACRTMKFIVKTMQLGMFRHGPSPLFTSKHHRHISLFPRALDSDNIEEALYKCHRHLERAGSTTTKKESTLSKRGTGAPPAKKRRLETLSGTPSSLGTPPVSALLARQFCSFLRSGVQCSLGLFRLHLFDVNYTAGTIDGFAEVDPSKVVTKAFLAFILAASSGVKSRNRRLLRKIETIESLIDSLPKLPSLKLNVPMSGKIVEFAKPGGVLFLQDCKTDSRDNSQIKCKHHHLPISQTLIQLSEWTQVRPFDEFREAFIYKEANTTYKSLKTSLKSGSLRNRRHLVETAGGIYLSFINSSRSRSRTTTMGKAGYNCKEDGFSHFNGSSSNHNSAFNERLNVRLAEFLTCKDHCVANLNLNFAFFALHVDLDELLNMIFYRYWWPNSNILTVEFQEPRKTGSSYEQNHGTKTTMLCLVNKKTGETCVHNTRAYLEFCNGYHVGNPQGYDAGDIFESVFQGIHLGEDDYTTTLYEDLGVLTRNGFKDPYLNGKETTLCGKITDSGCGVYGMV